jgi:alpha-ketoglutarate-dependent taurine dioxygenase
MTDPLNVDVKPVTARVGAEIAGIALSGDLPSAAIDAITAALLHHKVLFFRGQQHLTDAEQERFSLRLGKLVAHPTQGPKAGTAAILELDASRGGGRADNWHTDVTFVDAYPQISILRGVVIPEVGGDTIWSNTVEAYKGLPPELKAAVDQLWTIHTNGYDYAALRPHANEQETRHFNEVFSSVVYETEHAFTLRPESARSSSALLCNGSCISLAATRSISISCCSRISSNRKTRFAGDGARETSRSGTIGRRSTMGSMTMETPTASSAGRPSTATSRLASTDAEAFSAARRNGVSRRRRPKRAAFGRRRNGQAWAGNLCRQSLAEKQKWK